jgi:hypothetical protein
MRVYTLDNGVLTTPREVSQIVGITIKNARVRLATHTDPDKIYAPRRDGYDNMDTSDSHKMRCIKSRGMYDEMLVLALKSIGS